MAPSARVATARGSENSGHFCKYPRASGFTEEVRARMVDNTATCDNLIPVTRNHLGFRVGVCGYSA